jgi:hypothetical protein
MVRMAPKACCPRQITLLRKEGKIFSHVRKKWLDETSEAADSSREVEAMILGHRPPPFSPASKTKSTPS